MAGRKKPAPRRRRAGKVKAGPGTRTLAALRRVLTQRKPKHPATLRRAMILRERLVALRPDLPPSARREALRQHLDSLVPAQPGTARHRKSRR